MRQQAGIAWHLWCMNQQQESRRIGQPRMQHLWIDCKNFIRRAGYYGYTVYQRTIGRKISIYDFQTIDVVRQLPVDAVCVDIGVNEGQIFDFMVRHCRDGLLFGFEPIPHLYQRLHRKYASDRSRLHQLALSDREATHSFYYYPQRTAVSGLLERKGLLGSQPSEMIQVETSRLDQILSLSRLDLVKIDVEGAELQVLRGCREHLKRCRPIVIFELGQDGLGYYQHIPEDVYSFFDALGYAITLLKYYIAGHPPMDIHVFLHTYQAGYESQFIAYPVQNPSFPDANNGC